MIRAIPVALLLVLVVLLGGAPLAAQSPLPPPPPLDEGRFGAVATYDSPEAATAVGAGWTRVLFWWHQLQPGGPDDWNPYFFPDGRLNHERDAGRELVGLLAGTPPWASTSGSVRAVPDGLDLPYDHPDNLWGRFVMRVAGEYAGRIDQWIIWNEPDVWDDDHPGKTWDGTLEQYARLLEVAYRAARAANPDARILIAATTYWWDVQYARPLYLERLLAHLAADPAAVAAGGYFDALSLHLYFSPEQLYDVTRRYGHLLARYGFANKPLWINETNAPPSEDPHHPAPGLRFAVSLEEQAHFLIQGWAMGLAAGAERMSLYKMRDEPWLNEGVEPYGLVRRDGSLRPAFWSYRTAVTYLGGFESARLAREGALRRVVVERGALGRTTVLWNQGLAPLRATVTASAPDALLVDAFGPLTRLEPTGGRYTLWLQPRRRGEIGGAPLMLVEGGGIHLELERPGGADIPPPPSHDAPPSGPAAPPGAAEWAIPGGRFFTQTGEGRGGFAVVDDGAARFYSEFRRLGGAQSVGYPISRRFTHDGFVTQAFQKLVLQWRPEVGQAWPVNVLDELSRAGHDRYLVERRQTPTPLDPAAIDPAGARWDEIVAVRQGLLGANGAIRARYFSVPDPLTTFGLPTSPVSDMGNHLALRTQRAVFQQWKEAVPWAASGEVTIANGGAIARELGWLPEAALVPESP